MRPVDFQADKARLSYSSCDNEAMVSGLLSNDTREEEDDDDDDDDDDDEQNTAEYKGSSTDGGDSGNCNKLRTGAPS